MITEILTNNYPAHTVKQLLDDRQLLYSCLSWVLDGLDVNDLICMGITPDMAKAIIAIERKYAVLGCVPMKTILEHK